MSSCKSFRDNHHIGALLWIKLLSVKPHGTTDPLWGHTGRKLYH